jgi:hypothetical protein
MATITMFWSASALRPLTSEWSAVIEFDPVLLVLVLQVPVSNDLLCRQRTHYSEWAQRSER